MAATTTGDKTKGNETLCGNCGTTLDKHATTLFGKKVDPPVCPCKVTGGWNMQSTWVNGPASTGSDKEDAAKWRALISCNQISVNDWSGLGSARPWVKMTFQSHNGGNQAKRSRDDFAKMFTEIVTEIQVYQTNTKPEF